MWWKFLYNYESLDFDDPKFEGFVEKLNKIKGEMPG